MKEWQRLANAKPGYQDMISANGLIRVRLYDAPPGVREIEGLEVKQNEAPGSALPHVTYACVLGGKRAYRLMASNDWDTMMQQVNRVQQELANA